MTKGRDALLWLADALAGAMLVVLTALTFIDVVGRNIFDQPLIGSNELTEYSLALVTFLAYPVVAWKRQHIVVDLFDGISPRWLITLEKIVSDFLGAALFCILSYRLWLQALRLESYGDLTPQLSIPIFYAYFFMSVMSGVTALTFVLSAFAHRANEVSSEHVLDEVV
ncbi:TRAP transporter small permease [Paracoccus sp. J55]|uniref:TRAP transporter small permease n=1 Tax=Paracoccus sp. J55 TaxID=935849 RepID=UPI0004B3CB88|nr:TRAP transporter small permease [Paracoccus sp. J55]